MLDAILAGAGGFVVKDGCDGLGTKDLGG